MATNTSTIAASGSDYTTVFAWEAATDNDLVTAGNIEVGQLNANEDYSADDINIAGATTDASNYRKLTVHDDNWHKGTYAASGIARLVTDPAEDGQVIVDEDFFWMERHMYYHNVDVLAQGAIEIQVTRTGIIVSRCIIFHNQTNQHGIGILALDDSSTRVINIDNTVIHGPQRALEKPYNATTGNHNITINVDHCSLYSGSVAGTHVDRRPAGSWTLNLNVYNCASDAYTTADFNDTYSGGGVYTSNGDGNVSSDTSQPVDWTNQNESKANIFTNAASNDYSPAADCLSANANTAGSRTEPDSRQNFALDLGESVRPTDCDIGAIQTTVAPGGAGGGNARRLLMGVG